MGELERLNDQLRRAFTGDAWHGPSLREILDRLTPDAADARPIPGAHSARELAGHLLTWTTTVRRRLRGEICEPPPEEDWPAGEGGWNALRSALEEEARLLLDAASRIDPAKLHARIAGQDYTPYGLLEGTIQHTAYHGGQMALLARAKR